MPEKFIEFRGISKSFGSRQILNKVDLDIYEGQTTTIIGKSGTGKSVLLKHIIGLLSPDEGTISFKGKPLNEMNKKELNDYRSRLSFCFQNNALFDSLTVFENIALPLRKTTRLSKKKVAELVHSRIDQMELSDVPDKYPADLSGGMQKRVALARALITDPQIVLFDEPTTGQDPIRKNAILSMIAQYQKKFGFTTILISHELPDVFFISDRILVLYDKNIIFQGDYRNLQDLKHPFVDEFIKSLEGVQDELTGLHSRKGFENQYNKAITRKEAENGFAVIVFSVENMAGFTEYAGHTAAQHFIHSLGSHINMYFSDKGISNRFSRDQFMTMLPTTRVSQTGPMLEDFASRFKINGLEAELDITRTQAQSATGYTLRVMAGLAEGTPSEEIEKTAERALKDGQVIAEIFIEKRGQ